MNRIYQASRTVVHSISVWMFVQCGAVAVGQDFEVLWRFGTDNGAVENAGTREDGEENELPGSPLDRDDDYYFAGDFGGEIGVVAQDEPLLNLDRAILSVDPRNRYHFTLDAARAASANLFRITVDTIDNGGGSPGFRVLWNGVEVGRGETDGADEREFVFEVPGSRLRDSDGNSRLNAGPNVVTVEYTGGGGWIQFDSVLVEALVIAGSGRLISYFEADTLEVASGFPVTLAWGIDPAASVSIEPDIGGVDDETVNGAGRLHVTPSVTTTYTLGATRGAQTETAEVTVLVNLANAFAARPAMIRKGNLTELSWVVNPSAIVTIEPGIGNVDALTENGIGTLQILPAETVKYTLTATADGQTGRLETTVTVNPFAVVWQFGVDNGDRENAASVEDEKQNAPPGSPTVRDDDYYFAGDYGGAIGFVDRDEPWTNLDRAITGSDPRNRYHFVLSEAQAALSNEYRLTVDTVANGGGTPGFRVLWNGTMIGREPAVTGPAVEYQYTFSGSTVVDPEGVSQLVAGENVLTLEHFQGAGWIQFDHVLLEANLLDPAAVLIESLTASPSRIYPGDNVTLSWVAHPGAALSIDQGVGDVTDRTQNGAGSIDLAPEATAVYTLTASMADRTGTASVRVRVAMIDAFGSDRETVGAGDAAVLSWRVDPNASVTIEPGVGNVDVFTVDGVGAVEVTPAATTTYTLVAVKGDWTAQSTATVRVDPFEVLWRLGVDDDDQGEFSAERGSPNDPPGSAEDQDDDYYFAGEYGAPIGLITEDEPLLNFDRALVDSDPRNRIHFMLDEEQASMDNLFKLTLDWIFPEGLPIGFRVSWNGNAVFDGVVSEAPQIFSFTFDGAAAGVVPGENVLSIEREIGGGWIQFDHLLAEIQARKLEIRITGAGFDPGDPGFTLAWVSDPGRVYTIQSTTDLVEWTALAVGYPEGGATGSVTEFTDPMGSIGEGRRFYRVLFEPAPPVYFEDFESGAAGWEVIDVSGNGTTWEIGSPRLGPSAAHGGDALFGTDLDGNYGLDTEIILRSPWIDLTGVARATLEFWNFRDIEAPFEGELFDFGEVDLVDADGLSVLSAPPLFSRGGATGDWQRERIRLPGEALDRRVRLQFRFFGDNFQPDEVFQAGWYIDDVAVYPE